MIRFLMGVATGVAAVLVARRINQELPEMGYLGWSGPHPHTNREPQVETRDATGRFRPGA